MQKALDMQSFGLAVRYRADLTAVQSCKLPPSPWPYTILREPRADLIVLGRFGQKCVSKIQSVEPAYNF